MWFLIHYFSREYELIYKWKEKETWCRKKQIWFYSFWFLYAFERRKYFVFILGYKLTSKWLKVKKVRTCEIFPNMRSSHTYLVSGDRIHFWVLCPFMPAAILLLHLSTWTKYSWYFIIVLRLCFPRYLHFFPVKYFMLTYGFNLWLFIFFSFSFIQTSAHYGPLSSLKIQRWLGTVSGPRCPSYSKVKHVN